MIPPDPAQVLLTTTNAKARGLGQALPMGGLTIHEPSAFGDLLVGVVVALIAGIAVLLSRQVGYALERVQKVRPTVAIIVSALVIGGLAAAVMLAFDQPYDVVPFSGETAMDSLLTETSALAVLAIVVAKALSYGVSLGGGWRGGPIFPAAYIGVAAAVLMGLVITSTPMSALVVAGLAGGVAAMLKLPFTAGLLAIVILALGRTSAIIAASVEMAAPDHASPSPRRSPNHRPVTGRPQPHPASRTGVRLIGVSAQVPSL